VLGMDIEQHAVNARVKLLLKTWIADGALKVEHVKDTKGRPQPHIRVDAWVNGRNPHPNSDV